MSKKYLVHVETGEVRRVERHGQAFGRLTQGDDVVFGERNRHPLWEQQPRDHPTVVAAIAAGTVIEES